MVEHSYQALMKAIVNKLRGGGVWGNQVSEVIQPAWVKPYCLVYFISGGETNNLIAQDADYEIGVKVIADNQQQSLTGAAQVLELLNDKGEQDTSTSPLDGGTDWTITTSTAGRMIHLIEPFQNAQNIYHDGHVFSFVLGRTS